jgi:hypothetical protein
MWERRSKAKRMLAAHGCHPASLLAVGAEALMRLNGVVGQFQVRPASLNQQFQAGDRFLRSSGFATAQTQRCFVVHSPYSLKKSHFRATHQHAPETGVHAPYDADPQIDLWGNGGNYSVVIRLGYRSEIL